MDWTEILWVWFLGYLVVPYLLSFCLTAPKQLNQLNSNLLQLLLLNHSTKWADIFRVYYLTLLTTIDYATIEKSYTSIVSFANSNTFSLVRIAFLWTITLLRDGHTRFGLKNIFWISISYKKILVEIYLRNFRTKNIIQKAAQKLTIWAL